MITRVKRNEDHIIRMKHDGWKIFLACGALTLMIFGLHPTIQVQSGLYFGTGVLTVLAMMVGLWIYRPEPMTVWILLLIGQCFNVGGDLLFINQQYLGNQMAPDWLGAALYALGMLNYLVGLVVLFISLRRLVKINVLINGSIVAIGLSSLIWILQIAPNLTRLMSPDKWLDVVAFPAEELIIGAIASLFLMTSIGRTWSYRLLVITLLFYIMGLFFYNQIVSAAPLSAEQLHGWLPIWCNGAYVGAYFFLGSAYLHPSIQNLNASMPARDRAVSLQNVIFLGLAFLAGPLAYWVQLSRGITVDVNVVIVSMILIFGLVETRLALLVRRLESQNRQMGHQQVQLQYQASHDSLTNLPNRASLDEYLVDIAGRNPTGGSLSALLMIDLDHFKQVNDTFGHGEGDIVLLQVADQLIKIKRKEDMVARWGGDEFVFVIGNLEYSENAMAFARRLFHEVQVKVGRGENQVVVTLSIGGCMFRDGMDNIQTAMKRADIALYHAKSFRDEEKISFFPEDPEA